MNAPRKPRCSRKHAASLPLRQAVGASIGILREDRGMTNAELAARAGCSRGAIVAVQGGHVAPSLGLIEKLAAALGVTPGSLLRRRVGRRGR